MESSGAKLLYLSFHCLLFDSTSLNWCACVMITLKTSLALPALETHIETSNSFMTIKLPCICTSGGVLPFKVTVYSLETMTPEGCC